MKKTLGQLLALLQQLDPALEITMDKNDGDYRNIEDIYLSTFHIGKFEGKSYIVINN